MCRLAGRVGLCALMLTSLCTAELEAYSVVSGVVRDDKGNPVGGAYIHLNQGTYATSTSTEILPIVAPNIGGWVSFSTPDELHVHEIGKQTLRTDQNGRYQFQATPLSSYNIWIQNKKSQARAKKNRKRNSGVLTAHLNVNVKGDSSAVVLDVVLHEPGYKNPCTIKLGSTGERGGVIIRKGSAPPPNADLELATGLEYEAEGNALCANYWFVGSCSEGNKTACTKSSR